MFSFQGRARIESGEPFVEFLVKLSGEKILPRGEIARVGGFEGVVVGVAESGGNGNRQRDWLKAQP